MPYWNCVIVGARCAGAMAAMELASAGMNVLLIDQGKFPSDRLSTHTVQVAGVERLHRSGLLDALLRSGCPPLDRVVMDFGFAVVDGGPKPSENGIGFALCPRRTVLDALLVEAAVKAGAVLREGFRVESVVWRDGRAAGVEGRTGRSRSVEYADWVIGADGRRSAVARSVQAGVIAQEPSRTFSYYTYYTGDFAPVQRLFIRPGLAAAIVPTHHEQAVAVVQRPIAGFTRFRSDPESAFIGSTASLPDMHALLAGLPRAAPLRGAPCQEFTLRQADGPGWFLIGDATCHKDSVTAQGITDAFADAQEIAALLTGDIDPSDWTEALRSWRKRRLERIQAVAERAQRAALLEPIEGAARDQIVQVSRTPQLASLFLGIDAGTVPPEHFLSAISQPSHGKRENGPGGRT